ncbi:protein phosphatase 1 regulatory subunit 27-like [Sitodiplosis mosellana]|uniref:protein phosphatase 1 regulatory subunit 27-like n=1 Tax=Sitodiplosis mosellana TaxID=263140 RepID=UPI0024448EDF|nr:protein phosphatase 1 regulatory subunit 27-like [Sitodiplosis mosellana]
MLTLTINHHGYMLLHEAAISGNITAAKMLLDAGADINAETNLGFTPLFLAFAHFGADGPENMDMIEFLVQNGAQVKNFRNNGFKALRFFMNYLEDEE